MPEAAVNRSTPICTCVGQGDVLKLMVVRRFRNTFGPSLFWFGILSAVAWGCASNDGGSGSTTGSINAGATGTGSGGNTGSPSGSTTGINPTTGTGSGSGSGSGGSMIAADAAC